MAPDDSSSSGPGTPSRPTAETALDRVELAVEEAVGRAAAAAERTAERHLGHHAVAVLAWTFKAIGLFLLFVYFAFALLYLGTRYWVMPRIDEFRPRIEAAVSKVLGAQVTVDRIETGWHGFNPTLQIRNMQVRDATGSAALVLPELEATLSWASVPTMAPQFASIVVRAPELEIRRLPGNKFSIAGFVFDPTAPSTGDGGALDWVLAQRRIAIRDLRLRYVDESEAAGARPEALEFQDGDFEYRRGLLTHRLAVRARAPSEVAGQLELRMEFRHPPLARLSEFRRWTGRIFVQSDYADIGRIWGLLRTPAAGFDLRRGQGAVRTWMSFDQMHVQRLTADIALADVDVRLARDHEPLQLAGVQGRLMLQELDSGAWKGGQEFAFTKFSIVAADGLSIPATDLRLRVAPLADVFDLGKAAENDARRGEFTASRARIETLLQLAEHAPLRPDIRKELLERNLRGELFDTQITWDRPPQGAALRYTVQTRFSGLGSRGREADPPTTRSGLPRPGLPGFSNLAGTLTANEAGGKVRIDTEDATLEFPGVFEAPRLPASKLRVAAGWATQPRLELRFDAVQITSADLEATASGFWRATPKGPGHLDVTAHIARLSAPNAHVYAPLVLGSNVRNWLSVAFTAGEAVDGMARLRGDLGDFPFTGGNGEFLATTHIRGVGLDYLSPNLAPGDTPAKTRWPAVANLDGDLRVERNKLVFTGHRATVFDTRLDKIDVRIPELVTKDPHLQLGLAANGPVVDVLRFVGTSPIGGWLGNFLADTRGEGAATTDLRLDVPLKEAKETRVNGGVALHGVDLHLLSDLPTFGNATGRIEFTESSFRIANVTAGFVGGQLTVDGGSRPDGPITVTGSGTATPAGVRRLTDVSIVQRALDRSQGTTRYAGTLTVRNGRTELHLETSLAGWSVDLPPPLQKTATEEWPSRFDIVPTAEAGAVRSDRIRLYIANKIALQVARRAERNGPTRVTGSAIRVGRGSDGDVEGVPDSGMRVLVDLPRLDVDRWTPFFTAPAAGGTADRGAAAAPGADLPNLIAARVDQLVYSGKAMGNVVIGATRASEGDDVLWLANVVSDNATGSVNWRMPHGDSPGRVSARLARLLIPESDRTEMPDVFDAPAEEVAPALDIVVDSFELGAFKLGRLELVAQNTAPGVAGEWQLQRLEIANPDARMHATGRWYREPGAKRRTMALDMALEFNNAGRLLGRFGIADALKNGEGTLDAKINWRGGPLSLDYATLNGSMRLAAAKGQFLKADAGAGRLLGVLSLQALPRRMTLDFRDVFSEGFAFDSISATANVAAGVLSTKDFKMRSANASVLIEGSGDLRAETQNLHVLVLPEVSATSASLVYALLANPAIGLGTFIAQLLLRDPLSKAFSFEYDVTGSWRDPVVKRRERVASGPGGETALPGQETPAEPQPAQSSPATAPPDSPSPALSPSPSPSK